MKPLIRFGTLLCLILLAVYPVSAGTVLYDQPINQCCGDGGLFSNDPLQLAADHFNLAGGGVIDQVIWYGAAFSGLQFSMFNVEFYDMSSGHPGNQLYKYTAMPTIVDTGLLDPYGLELYQFIMDIPAFTANAGVDYFFSASDNGPFNFVWENSVLDTGGWFSVNGGEWNDLSGQVRASQAFTLLNNVPEPGTLALLGTGLAGLAGAIRRKLL